jgi:hypothetical protein
MRVRTRVLLLAVAGVALLAHGALALAEGPLAAATYRAANQPVSATADGQLVCEAEEFHVAAPGWQARPWGTNYYAATLANTFLSRKAYLGAPEQCDQTVASLDVNVSEAGQYLALVRYEAVYRFETQFKLRIEQAGQLKLERLYGARQNKKLWAFGQKLQTEVAWSWGAVENVVWEGHDATVDLAAGPARLTIIAERQPEPAARRNIDLVLLTRDAAGVQQRIAQEAYLPLDGLLTQSGDVLLKLHNAADGVPMTLTAPPCVEHSPYWVHQRRWKPIEIKADPGQSTDWIDVGGQLDTLNDGQWRLTATPADKLHYTIEIAMRTAAGAIEPLKSFERRAAALDLAYDADTRYSRRIRASEELLDDLLAYLKQQPACGPPPRQTPVFGSTFDPRPDDPRYTAARTELIELLGLTPTTESIASSGEPRGYIDVRGKTPAELDELGKKLQVEGKADRIAMVSLGDEIGLAAPPADNNAGFHAWLKSQRLAPAEIDSAAGDDWAKIAYHPAQDVAESQPRTFYYSNLYRHHFGIEQQKLLTDAIGRHLPRAGVGANFSPHHGHAYLGETHQWVTLFRRGGMTMPWSEDWIFQVPVGTQQMNLLELDLFRAGLKGRPQGKIQYYVMPHWPGNTPASWRRQFYGDLGHGMKIVNLFEFRPVQAAYTENHSSLPEMYAEVRRALSELAKFEDVAQAGQVRPGLAGLWFSETGDIWNDSRDPFAAGKRTLYIAIRHQQLPLDVVIDEDALAGDLKNYRVLYLADQHVSRAASKAIAEWVAAGGRLLATAGAGMFDEFHGPNLTLRELLGVEPLGLDEPKSATENVVFEKQDLPWIEPLDLVSGPAADGTGGGTSALPIFGARSRFRAAGSETQAKFSDGAPAVVRKNTGQGATTYCGFLPGLSYFHPALPRRPADRNSAADSLAHFIPTAFDSRAAELIASPASDLPRPISCSNALVEASAIGSSQGMVITLVNWSGAPLNAFTVAVEAPLAAGTADLATGGAVKAAEDGQRRTFTFDLDVADALILR